MRFVPKFHRSLIIKFIFFTIIYFSVIGAGFFNGDIDEMSVFVIESIGIYIMTVIFFFISWFVLNLIEISFVYEMENENYYRDIIKSVSPAQLSYIDDYGIECKKDIIATILMLHLKGNLKISNNKIEFISKFKQKEDDYYNLSKSEVAVLDCLSKGKSPLKIPNTFEKLLIEDLNDNGLIEKKDINPPHFYVEMVLQFIYGIILIVFANLADFISIILYAIGSVLALHSILWTLSLKDSNLKNETLGVYKKVTPKGNEIRLKLTGLKLFLRDYSNMKNKELREIELWDEYIIYSVILNDNKKVQKEILKMVKKQFKS